MAALGPPKFLRIGGRELRQMVGVQMKYGGCNRHKRWAEVTAEFHRWEAVRFASSRCMLIESLVAWLRQRLGLVRSLCLTCSGAAEQTVPLAGLLGQPMPPWR